MKNLPTQNNSKQLKQRLATYKFMEQARMTRIKVRYREATGVGQVPAKTLEGLKKPNEGTTFLKPYKDTGCKETPLRYQEIIREQLSQAIELMQSFLTKNGLNGYDLAPTYLQYPIEPEDNISATFNNLIDSIGLAANITVDKTSEGLTIEQKLEKDLFDIVFVKDLHLVELKKPSTIKSILHELFHRLGTKSIKLNFERADSLWQRFYNLIDKILKKEYENKMDYFDPKMVRILATVFNEAITEFLTLAVKPDFKMKFISPRYKNYLRFLIFSSFQLNYRDDVVDRYIGQITQEQKIKFLSDIFRMLLLPQAEIDRLNQFEILNSKKEERDSNKIFEGLFDFNKIYFMRMVVDLEENLHDDFSQNYDPVVWYKQKNPDFVFWNYFFEDNKLVYQPEEKSEIDAFKTKYQQDIAVLIQTIDELIYDLVGMLQTGEMSGKINLELDYKKKKII